MSWKQEELVLLDLETQLMLSVINYSVVSPFLHLQSALPLTLPCEPVAQKQREINAIDGG